MINRILIRIRTWRKARAEAKAEERRHCQYCGQPKTWDMHAHEGCLTPGCPGHI